MSNCALYDQTRFAFSFFSKGCPIFCAALLFAVPTFGSDQNQVVAEKSTAALPEIIKLYKWFHQNPELSEQESQTAIRFADELRQHGMEIFPNIGGHGFVGLLKNRRYPAGPVVLYRADMDALPIQEKTGAAYTSRNKGKMHACGHDIHMATAVGMVSILREVEHLWSGTLLFIVQP